MDRLLKIQADEFMKPARKNYSTRGIVVSAKRKTYSMDLADMVDVKISNSDYRFILVCVDVFTRYLWCEPLKNKTSKDVLIAFKKIVSKAGAPEHILVDKGTEFYNLDMTSYCKQQGIVRYSIYGSSKSAIAERAIKTLKNMIWTYFYSHNTRRWIIKLPDIVERYNTTKHAQYNLTPRQMWNYPNQEALYNEYYSQHDELPARVNKLKVGDNVRVSKAKGVFEKGFHGNWSAEIFEIEEVKITNPITYKLKDFRGEVIEGSFYEPELQKSKQKIDEALIHEVLDRKTVKGQKLIKVKYVGIEKEHWIPATNVL